MPQPAREFQRIDQRKRDHAVRRIGKDTFGLGTGMGIKRLALIGCNQRQGVEIGLARGARTAAAAKIDLPGVELVFQRGLRDRAVGVHPAFGEIQRFAIAGRFGGGDGGGCQILILGAADDLEKGVFFGLLVQKAPQFDVRHRQQADRLLQLRGDDQRLLALQLLCWKELHLDDLFQLTH